MTDNEAQNRYRSGRIGSFIKRYMSLSDTLANIIWKVCMAIGVLLVVIVGGQVFTRYVIGWVPIWGGELSRYLGIWVALLLTPVFIWEDQHLQVETLFRKLPMRIQRITRSIQLVLIAIIGWFIANWGLVYAIERGIGQSSPSLDFQMVWVYLSLPISGVLIVFFAVAKLIQINLDPDVIEKDYQSRFGSDENIKASNEEGS